MARSPKMGLVEKHAIKSMVAEGITAKKIAQLLKRGIPTINKYIDEELGGYPKEINMKEAIEPKNDKLDQALIEDVVNRLMHDSNMYRDEARELAERTARRVTVAIESSEQLHKFCINNTNVKNIMQTRSVGGTRGVAVMTAAASQRIDAKKSKFIAKDSSGHIFKQGDPN